MYENMRGARKMCNEKTQTNASIQRSAQDLTLPTSFSKIKKPAHYDVNEKEWPFYDEELDFNGERTEPAIRAFIEKKQSQLEELEERTLYELANNKSNTSTMSKEILTKMSPEEQEIFRKRKAAYKKSKAVNFLGFIVFLFISFVTILILNSKSLLDAWWRYPLIIISCGIVSIFFSKIMKKHFMKKMAEFKKNPTIAKHDNEVMEEMKKGQAIINYYKELRTYYSSSIDALKDELLNKTYANYIIFYGTNSSYRYAIHIDGNLIAEADGCKLVTLKMGTGIHSIRIEFDHEKITGDHETGFFPTVQFEASNEKEQAFILICTANKIRVSNRKEFEKTTKINLLL